MTMPNDHLLITGDTTIEAILEERPASRDVLVKHFGAGVTMPGQTWTTEPLSRACSIRGVNLKELLQELQGLGAS